MYRWCNNNIAYNIYYQYYNNVSILTTYDIQFKLYEECTSFNFKQTRIVRRTMLNVRHTFNIQQWTYHCSSFIIGWPLYTYCTSYFVHCMANVRRTLYVVHSSHTKTHISRHFLIVITLSVEKCSSD